MLKFRGDNVVLLGLSARNIKLLQEGKPIQFDGADVLLPGIRFGIFCGDTEMEMEQMLIAAGVPIPQ